MVRFRSQVLGFSKLPRFGSLGGIRSVEDVIPHWDEDERCPRGTRGWAISPC